MKPKRLSNQLRLHHERNWGEIVENDKKGYENPGVRYAEQTAERRRKEKERADKAKENK